MERNVVAAGDKVEFVVTDGSRERLARLGIEDEAAQDRVLLKMGQLAVEASEAAEDEWRHLGSPEDAAKRSAHLHP